MALLLAAPPRMYSRNLHPICLNRVMITVFRHCRREIKTVGQPGLSYADHPNRLHVEYLKRLQKEQVARESTVRSEDTIAIIRSSTILPYILGQGPNRASSLKCGRFSINYPMRLVTAPKVSRAQQQAGGSDDDGAVILRRTEAEPQSSTERKDDESRAPNCSGSHICRPIHGSACPPPVQRGIHSKSRKKIKNHGRR